MSSFLSVACRQAWAKEHYYPVYLATNIKQFCCDYTVNLPTLDFRIKVHVDYFTTYKYTLIRSLILEKEHYYPVYLSTNIKQFCCNYTVNLPALDFQIKSTVRLFVLSEFFSHHMHLFRTIVTNSSDSFTNLKFQIYKKNLTNI